MRVEGWDGRSAAGWGHLADGAGAIVNLAGAGIADSRWTDERKHEIVASRVDAGKAVVEAVQAAASNRPWSSRSSAVGYYGSRGDEIADRGKASQATTSWPRSVCDWEQSTRGVEALGVRRAVIRTGIVLSTEGGALPKMLLPLQVLCRRQARLWPTVVPLDPHGRRGGRDPLSDRQSPGARSLQPGCA